MVRGFLGLSLLFAALGCKSPQLGTANANLSVSPGALAFNVYVGAIGAQSVTLSNSGAAGADVEVALAPATGGGDAFALSGGGALAVGGGQTVTVTVGFAPADSGSFGATLTVSSAAGTLSVPVSGTALAPLTCAPLGPCDVTAFDADAGMCAHGVAANGTSCVDSTQCLESPQCESGNCVGTPKNCDDGNACTKDYCVSGQGCQHQDTSASCQGSASCHVYGCDPTSGCSEDTAPNGTACSTNNSCQSAEICVLGNCQGVSVPDGFPCKLWWDPCVDAGCHGGQCRDPVAEAERPGQVRWKGSLLEAAGPFAVDDAGNSFFTGFYDGGAPGLISYDACGGVRWTNSAEAFTGMMLDVDQAIAWTWDHVFGLDPQTGQKLWALDLRGLTCDGGSCFGATYHRGDAGYCNPYCAAWGDEDGCGGRCSGPSSVGIVTAALSNQGILALELQGIPNPSEPLNLAIVGAYRDGTVAWVRALDADFPTSLLFDGRGTVYVGAMNGGRFATFALDPTGAPLFVTPNAVPMAAGSDYAFLALSNAEVLSDGGIAYALGANSATASEALIASTGQVTTGLELGDGGPYAQPENAYWGSFSAGRPPTWMEMPPAAQAAGLTSELVGLGQSETLYLVDIWPDAGIVTVGDGGVVPWSGNYSNPSSIYVSWQAGPAIAPGATLLFSTYDDGVYSVFIGRDAPATDAPWPRASGGDNTGRNSAAYGF